MKPAKSAEGKQTKLSNKWQTLAARDSAKKTPRPAKWPATAENVEEKQEDQKAGGEEDIDADEKEKEEETEQCQNLGVRCQLLQGPAKKRQRQANSADALSD